MTSKKVVSFTQVCSYWKRQPGSGSSAEHHSECAGLPELYSRPILEEKYGGCGETSGQRHGSWSARAHTLFGLGVLSLKKELFCSAKESRQCLGRLRKNRGQRCLNWRKDVFVL